MQCTISFFLFFLLNFVLVQAQPNEIEKKFIRAGLVDVSTIDSTIKVDLVNSDPKKNFFRENYYSGLKKAYLQKEVAMKLAKAQKFLKEQHPSFFLQILDAARPRSVSQAMYNKVTGTQFERYVAHPEKGSMHNYGVAVDITIVDKNAHELDMGFSPFKKNTVQIYWEYAKKKLGKKLTEKQKRNRRLLSTTMKHAGFFPLSFEWWHFNGIEKEKARNLYNIIE
ncbi:MAG: peptidase M15 [Candidatus Electrothrix sp. AR4]|nr:peptidase M15 [Candidatus Electrothrix sp. AR4]